MFFHIIYHHFGPFGTYFFQIFLKFFQSNLTDRTDWFWSVRWLEFADVFCLTGFPGQTLSGRLKDPIKFKFQRMQN